MKKDNFMVADKEALETLSGLINAHAEDGTHVSGEERAKWNRTSDTLNNMYALAERCEKAEKDAGAHCEDAKLSKERAAQYKEDAESYAKWAQEDSGKAQSHEARAERFADDAAAQASSARQSADEARQSADEVADLSHKLDGTAMSGVCVTSIEELEALFASGEVSKGVVCTLEERVATNGYLVTGIVSDLFYTKEGEFYDNTLQPYISGMKFDVPDFCISSSGYVELYSTGDPDAILGSDYHHGKMDGYYGFLCYYGAEKITDTITLYFGICDSAGNLPGTLNFETVDKPVYYDGKAWTELVSAKEMDALKDEVQKTSESLVKQAESFKAEVLQETGARHANALKGYARGEAVAISDISPVAHDLDIKVSSKNVIPYPYTETTKTSNGITFTDNGDGGITIDGVATGYAMFTLSRDFPFVDGITYAISGRQSLYINYLDENGNDKYFHTKYNTTLTWDKRYSLKRVYIQVVPNETKSNEVICPMIEISDTVTEYEAYKEAITYPVSPDGTVEDVKSVYPNMTITTDTDGVVIDCEYNKDINKGFAELVQAIISLGGNV